MNSTIEVTNIILMLSIVEYKSVQNDVIWFNGSLECSVLTVYIRFSILKIRVKYVQIFLRIIPEFLLKFSFIVLSSDFQFYISNFLNYRL